ncbi:MAG: EpsG family protein [Muribaculaceae bacterium]|nr:EpsG family protein [Muribaculaceae bacterium]
MILIVFLFLLFFWYIEKDKGSQGRRTYAIVVTIVIFLIGGLRNMAVYADTFGYVYRFNMLQDLSVNDIKSTFTKDTFFYLFTYWIQPYIFNNYTLWFLLISAVYIIPIGIIIYRYSDNPMWSWVCFFFIGLFMFSMAGLRQVVAMGIALIGFLLLMKKKDIWFFVLVWIASLFHGTALIFVLIYPYVRFKIPFKKVMLITYAALVVVLLVTGSGVMRPIVDYIGIQDERYVSYGENLRGSTYTYFLQQLILFVPSIIILKKRLKEPRVALFTNIAAIALVLVACSPIIAEMFRVAMYFSWGSIILFSIAMAEVLKTKPNVPAFFMISLLLYLIFINRTLLTEYYFWFEDTSDYILERYDTSFSLDL